MNYDHLTEVYDEYLEHYGVKGMKWDASKKKGNQEDRTISGGRASDKSIADAYQSAVNRSRANEWLKNANRSREVVDTPYGRMTRAEYQRRARVAYNVHKINNSERSRRAQERVDNAMRNLREHQVKDISGKALDAGSKALGAFMSKTVKKKKS